MRARWWRVRIEHAEDVRRRAIGDLDQIVVRDRLLAEQADHGSSKLFLARLMNRPEAGLDRDLIITNGVGAEEADDRSRIAVFIGAQFVLQFADPQRRASLGSSVGQLLPIEIRPLSRLAIGLNGRSPQRLIALPQPKLSEQFRHQ
jgi:hypothetical protein